MDPLLVGSLHCFVLAYGFNSVMGDCWAQSALLIFWREFFLRVPGSAIKEKQLVQCFFLLPWMVVLAQIDSATRNLRKVLNYIINQFVFRGLAFSVLAS